MLKRFFEIKDFIDASDRALAVNLPSGLEIVTLRQVMKDLEEFETATKLLQDSKRTLLEVRAVLMVLWKAIQKWITIFQVIVVLCILLRLKTESLKFKRNNMMIFY